MAYGHHLQCCVLFYRRVVIAELQVITYNEYLPVVLSPSIMSKYRLALNAPYGYDPSVNPTVFNSFSTAGYRFGHTLISNSITQIHSQTRQVVGTYDIRDHYNQPQTVMIILSRNVERSDLYLAELLTISFHSLPLTVVAAPITPSPPFWRRHVNTLISMLSLA